MNARDVPKVSRELHPFIVGAGRSGTTLVASLLDTHERLHFGPEAPFMAWTFFRPWRYTSLRDPSALSQDLLDSPTFQEFPKAAKDRAQSYAKSSPLDFYHQLFAGLCSADPRSVWGDQTPSNVLRPWLLRWKIPNLVFIHVVRDGRDVARSQVRLGWADSASQAAFNWSRRASAGLRIERLFPNQSVRVSYERLIDDPVAELRPVFEILNLEPLTKIESYSESARRVRPKGRFEGAHERLGDPLVIHPYAPDPAFDRVVESISQRELGMLGYLARTDAPIDRTERLKEMLRWEVRRIRHRRKIP